MEKHRNDRHCEHLQRPASSRSDDSRTDNLGPYVTASDQLRTHSNPESPWTQRLHGREQGKCYPQLLFVMSPFYILPVGYSMTTDSFETKFVDTSNRNPRLIAILRALRIVVYCLRLVVQTVVFETTTRI